MSTIAIAKGQTFDIQDDTGKTVESIVSNVTFSGDQIEEVVLELNSDDSYSWEFLDNDGIDLTLEDSSMLRCYISSIDLGGLLYLREKQMIATRVLSGSASNKAKWKAYNRR
ncbi:hypothetical protein D3C76_706200 [compost metagenome]